MLGLTLSYRYLTFRRPVPTTSSPLPDGIVRHHVPTPSGPLELLAAPGRGITTSAPSPALFFVHGGMGSAWVWLEYMTYLSSRGISCYAISMRGHGESWHPSYLRMVWGTTKRDLADDVVAGLRFAQSLQGGDELVLVGHSSGGGLSQFILSEGDVRVKGLVLMGAVPGFGSLDVYINWWKLDPLFIFRMWLHGGHPNSPLSHPSLTRRVFFHGPVSDSYMADFQQHINAYECLWWPTQMMTTFVDFNRIVTQIDGWGSTKAPRVMVLRGEYDKLMTRPIMERLADTFRRAVDYVVAGKKIDIASHKPRTDDDEDHGVQLCVIPGAGHHMQNDVDWEFGAQKLLEFTRYTEQSRGGKSNPFE